MKLKILNDGSIELEININEPLLLSERGVWISQTLWPEKIGSWFLTISAVQLYGENSMGQLYHNSYE